MLPCIRPTVSDAQKRWDRWRAMVTGDPATLETMAIEHAASGVPMCVLEEAADFPTGQIDAFMVATLERAERYRVALDIGRERRKDKILTELMGIAFFDPIDIMQGHGNGLRNVANWPERARKAFKKLDVQTGQDDDGHEWTRVKVEFCDKTKALELLGREDGMFGQKQANDANESLAEILRRTISGPSHDGGGGGGEVKERPVIETPLPVLPLNPELSSDQELGISDAEIVSLESDTDTQAEPE